MRYDHFLGAHAADVPQWCDILFRAASRAAGDIQSRQTRQEARAAGECALGLVRDQVCQQQYIIENLWWPITLPNCIRFEAVYRAGSRVEPKCPRSFARTASRARGSHESKCANRSIQDPTRSGPLHARVVPFATGPNHPNSGNALSFEVRDNI